MNTIAIRKAEAKDSAALCRLLQQLFALERDFTYNSSIQEKGIAMLLQSENAIALVAEESETRKLVAMCTIQEYVSTAQGSKAGIIEDVVVSSEYRGHGIGSELMKELVKIAKEKNYSRLQLAVDNNNTKAQHFYKKHGWNQTNLSAWFLTSP
ncbi:MAG: GNAT family N-acetyltransferase [Spirochaetes bacterium]|jgi:ribosomal protein S18 acetylase RimI-like enzyme|nr:GNAT family N-acetyltransferase [Spirochaetota bacterium]